MKRNTWQEWLFEPSDSKFWNTHTVSVCFSCVIILAMRLGSHKRTIKWLTCFSLPVVKDGVTRFLSLLHLDPFESNRLSFRKPLKGMCCRRQIYSFWTKPGNLCSFRKLLTLQKLLDWSGGIFKQTPRKLREAQHSGVFCFCQIVVVPGIKLASFCQGDFQITVFVENWHGTNSNPSFLSFVIEPFYAVFAFCTRLGTWVFMRQIRMHHHKTQTEKGVCVDLRCPDFFSFFLYWHTCLIFFIKQCSRQQQGYAKVFRQKGALHVE